MIIVIIFIGSKSDRSSSSRLYKPTSKLAELASTFSSVKSSKEKERDYDDDVSVCK